MTGRGFARSSERWTDGKGFHCLLIPESDVLVTLLAATVETATMSAEFCRAADKISFVCDKLVVTDIEIAAVEQATRGQGKNPNWTTYRHGRITASNIGAVLKACASSRPPPKSLLPMLLGKYDLSGVHAVQWGIMHGPDALRKYSVNRGVTVEQSGLFLARSGLLGGRDRQC